MKNKKIIVFFVLIVLILGAFITFGYSFGEDKSSSNYIPEKLEPTDKVTDYDIDLDNNTVKISTSGKDNSDETVSGKAGIKYDLLSKETVPYIDLKLAKEITGIDFVYDAKNKVVTAKVPFTFNNADLNANVKITQTTTSVETYNVIGGHLYEHASKDLKHLLIEDDNVYIPATLLHKIGTNTIYNVVFKTKPNKNISITKVVLDMNVHDNTVLY